MYIYKCYVSFKQACMFFHCQGSRKKYSYAQCLCAWLLPTSVSILLLFLAVFFPSLGAHYKILGSCREETRWWELRVSSWVIISSTISCMFHFRDVLGRLVEKHKIGHFCSHACCRKPSSHHCLLACLLPPPGWNTKKPGNFVIGQSFLSAGSWEGSSLFSMPSLKVLLPKVAAWQPLVWTYPAAQINVIEPKLDAAHRANWPALARWHQPEPSFVQGSPFSMRAEVYPGFQSHIRRRVDPLRSSIFKLPLLFLFHPSSCLMQLWCLKWVLKNHSLTHLCLVLYFCGCGSSTV